VITAYWWKQLHNFGDAMSPMLIEFVLKKEVVWSTVDVAQLIGLGSILNMAIHKINTKQNTAAAQKSVIWGSGLMTPSYFPKKQTESLSITCVRGYLTAACFEEKIPYLGDPGLLVREVYPTLLRTEKVFKGCLCLHHTQRINPVFLNMLESSGWKVISAGTNDFFDVINTIAKSEMVISSSLHGLIVADSLMIPNAWYLPTQIHIAPEFKFYDYFTSIGREIDPPLTALKNMDEFEAVRKHTLNNYRGFYTKIEKIIGDLRESIDL
jgi:hypothetical protein